jgi:ribosomal protein S18 acetylase RimI-like enzyme
MEGMQFVQLEVSSEAAAVSFYEKKGFLTVEYLECYYQSGGNAVRMMCPVRGNS